VQYPVCIATARLIFVILHFMLLVYSATESPRLTYILHELLYRRIGVEYTSIHDFDQFVKHTGPKLNYSNVWCENSYQIIPTQLLFEKHTERQTVSVTDHPHWMKTIAVGHASSDHPFDIFSAAFYLLSRYEEYVFFEPDKHGRFNYTSSLAWQYQFLEIPLIDVWANQLRIQLNQQFPELNFANSIFQHISSIDVDFVYRYKGYGAAKQLMKWANALKQQRLQDATEQLKVFTGFSKDPYDSYAYIESVVMKTRAHLMYFFLTRNETNYDKNISHTSYDYKNAIAKLDADAQIGLHPSYHTREHTEWIAEEKQRLEKLCGRIIYHSRQHYLRLHLPETYEALELAGIRFDYSMMYADRCGFRASTCKPFQFFNLKTNKSAELQIHSPCVMDTTLRYAMELNPATAIRLIEKLMDTVHTYSGEFISIWHNSNLSSAEGWHSWRYVFQTMHNFAADKQ